MQLRVTLINATKKDATKKDATKKDASKRRCNAQKFNVHIVERGAYLRPFFAWYRISTFPIQHINITAQLSSLLYAGLEPSQNNNQESSSQTNSGPVLGPFLNQKEIKCLLFPCLLNPSIKQGYKKVDSNQINLKVKTRLIWWVIKWRSGSAF